jgi:hypothetical protein
MSPPLPNNGVNAMTAILNAVTGNPWTPTHLNV